MNLDVLSTESDPFCSVMKSSGMEKRQISFIGYFLAKK